MHRLLQNSVSMNMSPKKPPMSSALARFIDSTVRLRIAASGTSGVDERTQLR
jgi:hypothetical protein